MKKTIIIIISVFASIAVAFSFQRAKHGDMPLSELSMANIEALGNDETGGGDGELYPFTDCYREILYESPQNARLITYCVFAKCETVRASKYWNEHKCIMQ